MLGSVRLNSASLDHIGTLMNSILQAHLVQQSDVEITPGELGLMTKFSRRLEEQIKDAIDSDLNVLISGGTPRVRWLLAGLIHREGSRRRAPFVSFHSRDIGRTERLFPETGTVFVVQIDDLSPDAQTGLMKILDRRGSDGTKYNADNRVRILAGVSAELVERVDSRLFLPELFYRLNTVHLMLPSEA